MNTCPAPDMLQALIDDRLSSSDSEVIEAHVEVCAGCQHALEKLTGKQEKSTEKRPMSFDTSGKDFLHRLEQQPPTDAWLPSDREGNTPSSLALADQVGIDVSEALPAIPGYENLGELGRGGMGIVYSASQKELKRALAVKVLLEKHRNRQDLKERFLEEAQVMAGLQHPGIAPIHEIGLLADGRPFFSMKQVRGRTLAELLKRQVSETRSKESGAKGQESEPEASAKEKSEASSPVPPILTPDPHLLAIFEQVCQTVAYAHSQGILHRDLKPSNIMVGAFGEVQVMDWGLAKRIADLRLQIGDLQNPNREPLCKLQGEDLQYPKMESPSNNLQSPDTAPGRVLGTAAYMAPEQARGEIEQLDERSDVFGLGAILCEILTGKPPFAGDSQLDSHRRAASADLSDAFARLDASGAEAELVNLGKKCLAGEKDQRPRHAGAVAEAVANYQTRVRERLQQAEIERAAALARANAERRRRQVSVALATLAVMFVLAASGAGIWYYEDRAALAEEEANRQAEQVRQTADKAAHHEALEKRVTAALDEAEKLRKEFHKQLGDPIKVQEFLSNLEPWEVKLQIANATYNQAKVLAAGAVQSLRPELAARLEAVGEKCLDDIIDFDLAKELDEIRESTTKSKGVGILAVKAQVCLAYEKVFTREGYDIKKAGVREMAAKMRTSPLRFVLVAALDYWAELTEERVELDRLLSLARHVDPDPWRDQFRDVDVWYDIRKLQKLAAEVDPARQSPTILNSLASRLVGGFERKEAAALTRKALLHHPKDYWLHHNLGLLVEDSKVQVGCYYAALAVRPNSGWAHTNLAMALEDIGDLDGALAHYEKAVAANPNSANAHSNWGAALMKKLDMDGAYAKYKKALEVDPNFVAAYSNLGNLLKRKGDLKGAIEHYQKALALYDQLDEVQRSLHKKVLAGIHYNFGLALDANKEYESAVSHHQQAISLHPQLADARAGLGQSLMKLGKFTEARQATLEAQKLSSSNDRVGKFSEKQLQMLDQLLHADQKLALVLQRKVQAASAAEMLSFARLCQIFKQQYATAVRFYKDAFTADPNLLDQPPHRYLAGWAAALGGTGKGKDVDQLNEAGKAKLRQQALTWLKGELAWRQKQFQSGTVPEVVAAAKTMPLWQDHAELAGVREAAELAKLPETERQEWQKFWSDVATLLKQARGCFLKTQQPGKLNGLKAEGVHQVKLTAGKTYVFELDTREFDSYMRLQDPQGKTLVENDDGGSNLNARIIFRPTQDGTYRIVATSFDPDLVGAYTLNIWEFIKK